MKFKSRKFDGKEQFEDQDDLFNNESHRKRVKKERRQKYQVKNQKFHQIDVDLDDLEEFDF